MNKKIAQSAEARRNLHTHTHTHTHTGSPLLSPKQIGTICFANFFRVFAIPIFALIFTFCANGAWAATFELTTVELAAGDTFQFKMSAAGEFYVDCGTDGVLSGTGVSGDTITRANTTEATYTCTYSSTGAKTIQFAGTATGHSSGTAAIRFNIGDNNNDTNAKKIVSISGSLGQIFGTIANPSTGIGQPRFYRTFFGATNMTGTTNAISDPNNTGMNYALPPTLFNGISGQPQVRMFSDTFANCNSLTGSIPSGLFGDLSGSPATFMFSATFSACSSLTGKIPDGLFGNLSGSPASYMFSSTFYGCRGLTGSIPSGLFGSLSGSPANNMFSSTFNGCSGLTGSIPSGLFGNLSGSPANNMFSSTFNGCSGLTGSIPSGLFGNLSGSPASYMFSSTFSGCRGLTGSIPSGLFGNLSGSPAQSMFSYTFNGCSGLTGSIPSGLFGNLSGSPADYMFLQTFSGCSNLSGSIPSGLFGNLSGTPAKSMFQATFQNCNRLTGSIPSGLFGNLSGSPADYMFSYTFNGNGNITGFGDKTYVPGDFLGNITTNTSVSNQATNMFNNTQLNNPCPANTYASTRTQFNDAGKPWCSECPSGTISPAGSTDVSQCVVPLTVTYTCGSGASGTAPTDTNSYLPNATVNTVESFGTCTKTGYYASGWVCGGTSVGAGGTFTITADTTCVAQWTGNSISLTWDGDANGTPASCTYGGTFVPPTPAARTGYVFTGWQQCSLSNLDTSIGILGGTFNSDNARWKPINGSAGHTMAQQNGFTENSDDLDNGEWAMTFSYGTVKGMAKCSDTNGAYATTGTPSDTSGQYCWCRATGYTPTGGNQCNLYSTPWVFGNNFGNGAEECINLCAFSCLFYIGWDGGFKPALYGQSQ